MKLEQAISAAQRRPQSVNDQRNYADPEHYQELAQGYKTAFGLQGYDGREEHNLKTIARFAAAHRTRQLDKGLCIVGGNGRGKSLCTRILSQIRRFRFREAVEVNERWKGTDSMNKLDFWEWLEGPAQSPTGCDLVIDDLGRENQLNNFGTHEVIMDRILEHRVQLLHRIGALTVITTNLWVECPTEGGKPLPRDKRAYPTIVEHYGPAGERIKSRLYELCHIVRFTGPDQRKES